MAKSSKDVQRNVNALKKAMSIKGDIKPGDLQNKANQIMQSPQQMGKMAKKLPPVSTKTGLAIRGLI